MEEHYKLISGIIVPIIIAIIGIFKFRSWIKKNNVIKGNNNAMLIAEKDIRNSHSFNTVNQSGGVIQITGDNNQVGNFDMKMVQRLAHELNAMNYPYAERAFGKFQLNSQGFLSKFNSQIEQLSPSELDKFSEVDVQKALYKAIQGAGGTSSVQIHEILSQLVMDRVQQPKRVIAELAINESIEVAAKLDVCLIKILALSFMFSKTKYIGLLNEDMLTKKLVMVVDEFKDLEASTSKFEYLEAISCGKVLQFISSDLIKIISSNYPHLFLKKVSAQHVKDLALPIHIQDICFLKPENDTFEINPHVGLYLFDNVSNGFSFVIKDDAMKEQLKDFLNSNRLSEDEIKTFFLKIPNFESILKIWNGGGFPQFSLTAVGVVIGKAYLEQKKFGNYDINIWIN